jgi:hypothetical protein
VGDAASEGEHLAAGEAGGIDAEGGAGGRGVRVVEQRPGERGEVGEGRRPATREVRQLVGRADEAREREQLGVVDRDGDRAVGAAVGEADARPGREGALGREGRVRTQGDVAGAGRGPAAPAPAGVLDD